MQLRKTKVAKTKIASLPAKPKPIIMAKIHVSKVFLRFGHFIRHLYTSGAVLSVVW